MIGIIIAESRNVNTTEKNFFIGLRKAISKLTTKPYLLIRHGYYNKPNNFKTTLEGLVSNNNITIIFVICDKEDRKVEKTLNEIRIIKEGFNGKWKDTLLTTENSNEGYVFEDFLGHYKNTIVKITGDEHKSSNNPFQYFGKKFHVNFMKRNDVIHLKNMLDNLARDNSNGMVISKLLELLQQDGVLN